ncbi:MAG TPA: iron-containing alcohol dehydrogenase [Acetobacteraceae bacterium]|jgi:alcohol dehydrogenase class IV|nr:iron-containing alcohol dehydrogenase [Acetobacteraceae bacterium]
MIEPGTYEYFRQERVIFGKPLAAALVEELARHDAHRIFVVATRSLSRRTDVVAQLRGVLDNRFAGLFDDVESHVPRASAVAAAAAARAASPDLLISIGGGSALDTGKMVQLCLAESIIEPRQLDAFRVRTDDAGLTTVPIIAKPALRQIAIPTTLSGAEWSHTTGSIDPERHTKDIYIQAELAAPAVILDAAISVHTPMWVWLSSGMRAVDHAIGSLCSKHPTPFSDATTVQALGMLNRSLRRVMAAPDDLEARLESLVGVWLASTGMMRMQYGASHGLSWHLSALADVPHGDCSCVLLPAVLRFNQSVNGDRQRAVSKALERADLDAADAVLDLIQALGRPHRLRDVGITRAHIDTICQDAMHNLLVRNNPRSIDRPEHVREILEMAW